MFGPLLDVQLAFSVAGVRNSAPCQKWAKREGFVADWKTLAGVGRLKRIWSTHYITPHYTLHYTTLYYATMAASTAATTTTTSALQLQLQLQL